MAHNMTLVYSIAVHCNCIAVYITVTATHATILLLG